jgi:hypothetical protein
MSHQELEAGFKAWQDALNRGDMETFFAARTTTSSFTMKTSRGASARPT